MKKLKFRLIKDKKIVGWERHILKNGEINNETEIDTIGNIYDNPELTK